MDGCELYLGLFIYLFLNLQSPLANEERENVVESFAIRKCAIEGAGACGAGFLEFVYRAPIMTQMTTIRDDPRASRRVHANS